MDLIATTTGAPRTMSTREIAELTGKEHKNVLADARKMLDELGLTSAEFSADLPDAYGRQQPVLMLPKRECLILVSGYSVQMRARIIDRWQELERGVAPALPRTFAEALRLAAEQAELLERQQQALAIAEPKAAALDRLAGADGTMCVTNAAKALKVPPRKLFSWLSAERWIYKRAGSAAWTAYQDRIQSGLLQHKTTTVERSDGSDKVVDQVLVTAKGLAKLAKAFGVEGGAA